MANAGAKKTINEVTLKEKEVYLDKALKPVDKAKCAFIIKFCYSEAGNNLKKITFTPTNSTSFKAFCINEDIINRYSGLQRPDDNLMNILRKRSLESLVSLKKYVFECQIFIN